MSETKTKTEAKTETKTVELSARAAAISEKVTAGVSIDEKTGLGIESGTKGDVFKAVIDEHGPAVGVTMETLQAGDDLRQDFNAGAVHAFGTLAVAAMTKNKKLDSAVLELGVGKNELGVSVQRSKTYAGMKTEANPNPEPVVKYGVVTATYDTYVGSNTGDIKKARTLVGQLASSKLA